MNEKLRRLTDKIGRGTRHDDREAVLCVVVCSDFHHAVGPFPDPLEAAKVALAMTRDSTNGCTYRPVRLALPEGATVSLTTRPERPAAEPRLDSHETRPHRGYL